MKFHFILLIYFVLFLLPNFVHSQGYFTEKEKNVIIQQHVQRLAQEAMEMFENQFRLDESHSNQQTEIFNQMINYKGLYENLDIRNISSKIITTGCHERLMQPLLGFDYKRHRHRHHLVCFSKEAFVVRTFRVDNLNRNLIFDQDDSNLNGIKKIQGSLLQIKFYRQYDSDRLFLAALISKGLQQIHIYEVFDGPIVIDKELFHTFQLHERITELDVIHFDNNKHRIVALIDSGWKQMEEFVVETTESQIILIKMHQALRLRTLRIQSQGFLVVANTTHWAVYRYQDRLVELINLFQMRYHIQDMQLFSNGHRYYVGVATHKEQYIYRWKDSKLGFQGVARIRLPMVYKMNSITLSYSREDNFFYFDQLGYDTISIYGYDITNSVFLLLRTFSKTEHLNNSKEIVFHPFYSVNFYDHNYAYELKLSKHQMYLFSYETAISHYGPNTRNQSKLNHNLQRYNKELYERNIELMTKNIFKLNQKETISKSAVNLTFNFNVTFRANVHVNRYQTDDRNIPKKIHINRRDYTMNELRVSMDRIKEQFQQISVRMEQLNRRLQEEVVYRNQNVEITGFKQFADRVFIKKIYARKAHVNMYRGRNVNDILASLYRIGQDVPIIGRKIFVSDLNVHKFLLVNKINGIDLDDFLYTDLDQDIYSNVWYPNHVHTNELLVNNMLSSNISLSKVIFINQNSREPIYIQNKLVFDSIKVDNFYVDTIDGIPVADLPNKVLTRRADDHLQVIKIPTLIEKLHARNDIFVNFINGYNVSDVFENLIFRNRNIRFDYPVHFLSYVTMNLMTIHGRINDVRIPEDLMDRHSQQIVYGVKRFSSVHVENLNVTYLNHLQIPADIVTLSRDEVIPRDLNIDRILVNGNLKVNGLFNDINLTHLDQRFIDSFRDQFQNLTFLKPVNVHRLTIKSGIINDIHLDQLYSNVYFQTQPTLFIQGKKTINNFLRCSNILAKTVNGEVLRDYLSVREPATFTEKVIFVNGAHFSNVHLHHRIDNVKIDELLNESVSLTTYQVLNGSKNFLDGIKVRNHFKVEGKINQMSPENWMRYSKGQNISSPMKFTSKIHCGMLIRDGNFEAETLNGENFTSKTSNLLYLNQPYTMNALLHCINCSANNLVTSYVNGKNFSHFLENYFSKSKPQLIHGEKKFITLQQFNDIYTTNGIDGIDLKTLKYQAVTKEGYNIITNPVVIHGDLILTHGRMNALKCNHINLKTFNHEVVHRDFHEKIRVQGDIVYLADVDFMTNVRVHKLNQNVPEQMIMTTNRNYTIHGNVRLKQRLISPSNIDVSGLINSVNLTELEQYVLKTNKNGELIVDSTNSQGHDGKINFLNSFETNEIIVHGMVDDVILNRNSILMTNGEQNVKKLVLDGPQWFNGSINVMSQINQYDKDYLHKIVLVNSPEEQQIDFQKTFARVIAKEIQHNSGLINVKVINSVNLALFNSNVLYSDVDRVVNVKHKFLDNITVNNPNFQILGLINGIRMADVVRLDRVRQTITGKKIFDSIVFNEDIDVHGLVNAVDMPKISKNMLLVYGNQHIRTPISFIAPVFMMSNNTIEWFNQFRPEDLITLHGDHRVINQLFNFNNIIVPKVYVQKHLVNGINLTDVYQHGFMTELGPEHTEQVFDGSLWINEAIFNKNVSLTTRINDLDLSETIESISNKFNPQIDPHQMSQELFKYKQFVSYHKHYYEYLNLEIDYFYHPNMTFPTDPEILESLYYQQRFNVFNGSSYGDSLFETLYKRKHILWQTVKMDLQNRLVVAEIWPQPTNGYLFRLISFELMTGYSWIVFEKNQDLGFRPFLFLMNNSLYIIYYDYFKDDENCWKDPNLETKLFRLDMDLQQLNHSHQWIQTFPHENIVNVGHYFSGNKLHYLVFNLNTNGDNSGEVIIYQHFSIDCRFRWFQTISISEPIRYISLFTLGITSSMTSILLSLEEPYMALRTDTYLYVLKQEGIQGFTRRWSMRTDDRSSSMKQRKSKELKTSIHDFRIHPFIYAKTHLLFRLPILVCVSDEYQNRITRNFYYEAHFNQYFIPENTILNLLLHDYV